MNKLTQRIIREEFPNLAKLAFRVAKLGDLEMGAQILLFAGELAEGEHQAALEALEQVDGAWQTEICSLAPRCWAWLDPENDRGNN